MEEVPQSPRTASLKDFLSQAPVSSLPSSSQVIELEKTATTADALKVLGEHQLLCLPVRDDTQQSGYLGFIDVLDIVASLSEFCKETNCVNTTTGQSFLDRPVVDLVGKSKKDEWITVSGTDSVLSVLDKFAHGVHRVAVRSLDSEKIYSIVTQSDMLRLLLTRVGGLSKIMSLTLKELSLVKQWVLFVNKNDRAIHTYRKMWEHKVSAIAVLDDKEMVCSVSATDLRGIVTPEEFKQVALPNMDFIHKRRNGDVVLKSICSADDKLEDVCKKILENRLHRLWVVDAHLEPRGVVSLTDICRAVLTHLH